MTGIGPTDSLWKELWDYDPNALLVVDGQMQILVVNPAFCRMFQVLPETAAGMNAERLLGDVSDLREALASNSPIPGRTRRYPNYGLVLRMVGFALRERNLVAVIFHDISNEERQAAELKRIREQAAEKVNAVVERQMTVVQEIAGLLGETMGQARVSLYELMQTIDEV